MFLETFSNKIKYMGTKFSERAGMIKGFRKILFLFISH